MLQIVPSQVRLKTRMRYTCFILFDKAVYLFVFAGNNEIVPSKFIVLHLTLALIIINISKGIAMFIYFNKSTKQTFVVPYL